MTYMLAFSMHLACRACTFGGKLLGVICMPCHSVLLLLVQVAQVAANVDIPEFVPKQGVQIETDPKATAAKSSAIAAGDDEAFIEGMISELQVGLLALPFQCLTYVCCILVMPGSAKNNLKP